MSKPIGREDTPSEESRYRLVRLWHRAENTLLVSCLVAMILLAFTNILIRNTVGGGIVWADKLLINLVLWLAVLGAAAAGRDNRHVTIDIVTNFVSERRAKYCHVVTNCFAAVICALLTYHSALLVATIEYPEHKSFLPHVESWVPMAIFPFGFALMTFRYVRHMILDIGRIRAGGEEP